MFEKVVENVVFVVEFLGLVIGLIAIAYFVEHTYKKKDGIREKVLSTKKMTLIGLFSAISMIVMLFEVPVPFAPPFYKIDLSELPIMIIAFAYGPVAGVMTEFCKILLKLVFRSTTTAFVGEMANFAVGCALILPASILYTFHKNKNMAWIGCVVGTLIMTVFGTVLNAIYLLPKFAQMYGMDLDSIVAMGTALNPAISSVYTFVLLAVAPLNLIKGIFVSVLTILLYKRLRPILK